MSTPTPDAVRLADRLNRAAARAANRANREVAARAAELRKELSVAVAVDQAVADIAARYPDAGAGRIAVAGVDLWPTADGRGFEPAVHWTAEGVQRWLNSLDVRRSWRVL